MSADVEPRVESAQPIMYRLYKRANGDLVLQGCYQWFTHDQWGREWRDILTEYESVASQQSDQTH